MSEIKVYGLPQVFYHTHTCVSRGDVISAGVQIESVMAPSLPVRTSEQGNVIGSVRIYIYMCVCVCTKKIVI